MLVYRVQKSTLGPRLGHWKRACTSLVYNQPHWLFHHSMECSQPEWYKIDIENFTDEDLIEPTSSLCFFLKVCELYKLCTRRKIDSAFSLRLSPLLSSPGLYSMVLVLFVTTLFSFGLSHCLLTYLAKWAIFLWLSWLRAISEATYICFLGLRIFLSTCSYPILGHKRTKSTLIQWNLDLTNLYKMKSLIKQMIFFTPVIVKCIPKKKPWYNKTSL